MVWSARISPFKKLALIGMFCGGLITAVAGILRCTFVLLNRPDGPQLAGEWSCRESFIAVFISNIPVIYPLVYRLFKRVRNATSSHSRSRSKGSGLRGTGQTGTGASKSYKLSTLSGKAKKKDKFKHPLSLPGDTFYERYGSEEEIIGSDGKPITRRTSDEKSGAEVSAKSVGDDIMVTREWEVQNHSRDSAPARRESGAHFHAQ